MLPFLWPVRQGINHRNDNRSKMCFNGRRETRSDGRRAVGCVPAERDGGGNLLFSGTQQREKRTVGREPCDRLFIPYCPGGWLPCPVFEAVRHCPPSHLIAPETLIFLRAPGPSAGRCFSLVLRLACRPRFRRVPGAGWRGERRGRPVGHPAVVSDQFCRGEGNHRRAGLV